MKLKIKIMGVDPIANVYLIATKLADDTTAWDKVTPVAYPKNFRGATTKEELLLAVNESLSALSLEQKNIKEGVLDETWVGTEVEQEALVFDLTEQTFDAEKAELLWQYPPANMDSINALCNKQYDQMMLAPLRRGPDATIVGVYVNGYGGSSVDTATRALASIKEVTAVCKKLGVPMWGTTTPTSGADRAKFQGFLASISSINKFIESPVQSAVYQDWSVDLHRARKATLINSERNKEINSGIDHVGHVWDTDEAARSNIVNWLSVNTKTANWRTKDNVMVVIDLEALMQKITAKVTAAFEKSWTRKEALKATTTIEEVDAI